MAFLVLGAALLLSTPAWSQTRDGFARTGGYAAVTFVPKFTFDGETFDGRTGYREVDGDEIAILPKLDEQTLIRIALGHRWRQGAFEVSYDRTKHGGTFGNVPVDSTFQAVNVDGRLFLVPDSPVQPYGLFGGSFPWLKVEDGSMLRDAVGDARFRGWGINTEAGIAVYPHPRLGVLVGYSYRAIWFDRASGVTDTFYELRPRFRETSKGVVLTGLFTF